MPKTINISFQYTEFENIDDLESSDRVLLQSAIEAAKNAYAPYSDFKVGAAVRLESGRIVNGTNVENASFPSGICAERTALSGASSNYPGDSPVAMAVAAISGNELSKAPVSPCGNCRQVIAEEETRNKRGIRLILGSKKNIRIIEKGGYLLPLQFSRDDLPASTPR
jgi:cytidine deaminase